MKLEAGTFITPSLRLRAPLGAGGMGSVWIAEHTGLRTKVVVKFMSEVLAKHPESVGRFSREAAAASQVRSPHVVQMIDYGVTADGTPYIAMEYLEGQDLAHRLALQPVMPPREVATIIVQASKALARAHDRGVVHRDIKPDNIFLADIGGGEAFVKVLDFGIAKAMATDTVIAHGTRTGAALGTPLYMSPEQVLGARSIDHRTDLWALGVVAFEALTGRRPFNGETIGALSVAICHGPVPLPSQLNTSLHREFDGWFAKACARDPSARFTTASELAEDFERIAGGTKRVHIIQTEDDATLKVHDAEPVGLTSSDVALTNALAAVPVRPSTTIGASLASPAATTPTVRSAGPIAALVGGATAMVAAAIVVRLLTAKSSSPKGQATDADAPTAVVGSVTTLLSTDSPPSASGAPSSPISSAPPIAPSKPAAHAMAPSMTASPSTSSTLIPSSARPSALPTAAPPPSATSSSPWKKATNDDPNIF